MQIGRRVPLFFVLWATLHAGLSHKAALADESEAKLAVAFRGRIHPLLLRFCGECHSGDTTEADFDLGEFTSLEKVRRNTDVWLKVRQMLDSAQMPPKESTQPSDEQRKLLQNWVRTFLRAEAEATAGDPGPVVLRRLNNEEYNYTVRDLTGVSSLDPTEEFPVDGAAGEGFINTGAGQSMSPAFVTKYLDAAKAVASHAVLLPDGIAFSAENSRRDWTDERLANIRRFYERYTSAADFLIEVGGAGKVSNSGGAIPLARYLVATLEEKEALENRRTTIEEVARRRSLNAKYLGTLWRTLTASPSEPESPLTGALRRDWRRAAADRSGASGNADKLVSAIAQAQKQLWKFNSVGQLTEGGKQKVWMEAVSPVTTRQELRLVLPAAPDGSDTVFYLIASDLGDGGEQDYVVWTRPRFEFKPNSAGVTHPPLLLRDAVGLVDRVEKTLQRELLRTKSYLDALAAQSAEDTTIEEVAKERLLNAALLQRWAELVGLDYKAKRDIRGHLTAKVTQAHGYVDVNGWGTPSTPNMLTNRSKEDISFLTLTVPARSVVMHPSPTRESIAAWRSPLDGKVRIEGLVADADSVCGNGAAWRLELFAESGATVLAKGLFDNGGKSQIQPKGEFAVRRGDVLSLIVNARDKSHSCDTTHVALTLTEIGGAQRRWDLASDVVDRILEANPLSDSYGNPATWHFCANGERPEAKSVLIPGSTLAQWRSAVISAKPAADRARLAESVQSILTTEETDLLSETDRQLRAQLTDWKGPLRWLTVAGLNGATDENLAALLAGLPHGFGKHPDGSAIESASVCVRAPRVLELRLPARLVAGSEFVVAAELHAATASDGSAQVRVSSVKPASLDVSVSEPMLVSPRGSASQRLESAIAEFRNLFPPAVCYSRIVPVDEVVTMTLFFREDEHLQRLMLNDDEVKELNRLWDELLYVAQEPIALTVAFEQIYEFATQDRPDLVKAFGPMRKPINDRADVFRKRLVQTEPVHLNAVLEFADRAWRRPLTESEQVGLRQFYGRLRSSEIKHDEAIRLMLARVLTSPAFLYRREQPAATAAAQAVQPGELATRLSYFLWSSMPDAELRRIAKSGRLVTDDELRAQTRRMLSDERTRRLAVQFACQWLHLRDFDQNDDKNEKLYPEFATLRRDMYEETVRFFEDMFRNNGSVLELVKADHTFLNESLAKHYGIEGVSGSDWRRVDGVLAKGRGGVFGMASLLASQSGASRTSPILRGNWVYETLLGERLPRPPANVPQLPESVPEGLTARQLIEKHSSVAACAKCHAKIDPFGFALEQYDAIGRLRPKTVDTRTKLEKGTEIEGIDGLRDYLLTERQDEIVRQFCRKLLGFALGREVLLSDELLLDKMQSDLKADGFRFHAAVEAIVTSSQFRKVRGVSQESRRP